MATNKLYSPNSSRILKEFDRLKKIYSQVKEASKLLDEFQNISNDDSYLNPDAIRSLSAQELTDNMNTIIAKIREKYSDPNTQQKYQQYLETYAGIRQELDDLENKILQQASKMFGFQQRDYLIKPLKDLLDELKNNTATPASIQIHIKKLIKTIGINKAFDRIDMVPYVGPVISGILNVLDNFSSTQPVFNGFADILEKSLPQTQETSDLIEFIRDYTQDSNITSKYNDFKAWLADGAEFSKGSGEGYLGFLSHFLGIGLPVCRMAYNENPDNQEDSSQQSSYKPTQGLPYNVSQISQGGGMAHSKKIIRYKRTNSTKTLKHINHTIKQHISKVLNRARTRRTGLKPVRKSIASRNVK